MYVYIVYIYTFIYMHIYIYVYIHTRVYEHMSRHTCLAQSASDCAKEVPQAPEKVAFGTFWAPGGLLWHSQRLTVPNKVCRFPTSFFQKSEKKHRTKTVLAVVANFKLFSLFKFSKGHRTLREPNAIPYVIIAHL